MTASAGVADALAGVVSSDRTVRVPDPSGRWSLPGGGPHAVAAPASVEELAAILARASEEGWTVLPAGRGSRIRRSPVRGPVDLVLATERLDAVEEYEPGDLTLTGGAGLALERVQDEAARNGQWLPLDPPGWPTSSLGGMIAAGHPGPLVAAFGRPRDHLLGVTLVTGDGRVLRPGGRVVKNVAGYDLVRLVAGSGGGLGMIASATVRLFPLPGREVTLLWRGADAGELTAEARALATAPLTPGALELLAPAPDPGVAERAAAVLALRILESDEGVEEAERIFVEAAGRAPDGRVEDARSRRWHRTRCGEEGRAALGVRLALLPARLDELLDAAGALRGRAEETGGTGSVRIHVTEGIARVEVGRPASVEPDGGAWAPLLRTLREELEAAGGSLVVTAAPPELLARVPVRGDAGAAGRLAAGLEEAFDPAGVLAPARAREAAP